MALLVECLSKSMKPCIVSPTAHKWDVVGCACESSKRLRLGDDTLSSSWPWVLMGLETNQGHMGSL